MTNQEIVSAVISVFKEYEGEIKKIDEYRTVLTSTNELTWTGYDFTENNEEDGTDKKPIWIERKKKVPCTAEVETFIGDNGREFVSFGVSEKTCQILGGQSGPISDEENIEAYVSKCLDRFQFRRKDGYEQLSLF
jgi:hypothetical protein